MKYEYATLLRDRDDPVRVEDLNELGAEGFRLIDRSEVIELRYNGERDLMCERVQFIFMREVTK